VVELLSARDLITNVPDAVVVVDENLCLRYGNPAAERLFGWRAEDHVGTNALTLVHPDDAEFAILSSQTVMEKEVGSPIEVRVMTAGGWRLVELIGTRYRGTDLAAGIVLSLRDLTERRRWEVAGDDVTMFRTLLQNAAAVTMLVDPDGTVRAASAAVTRALGHDPGHIRGKHLRDLVEPVDQRRLEQALAEVMNTKGGNENRRVSIDLGMTRRDGGRVPFQLTIVNLVHDPTVPGLVVSGQDISELHAARERLAHAAEHDELTGLPNRTLLTRQLAARLGEQGPRTTAVAFLDLDRFKIMNDLFGHDVGDEILVTVARRLRSTVRATDIVARYGGDEFVVVASTTTMEEIEELRVRLENAISEPMRLRSGSLQVFASVGMAVGHPGDLIDEILNEADAAMYDVKHLNRGAVGARTRPLTERRELAEDLDRAFGEGQFEVHYQPIVELRHARTVALEALVRWHHPRRGLLLPGDFIDVVEDTRRDDELGDLVARRALTDLKEFRDVADCQLVMSMNVSMVQLSDPGFADRMKDLVRTSGFSPRSVAIEVSERGLLDQHDQAHQSPAHTVLASLSEAGFHIAVDDFGTGYSSLSHLVAFPVDVLKIDQSFVAGLGHDKSRESIVAALMTLAQSSGMKVVAEGIEQESHLSVLRRLGCTYGQGFYFSRALTTSEMCAELRARAILGTEIDRQTVQS
jgi:diguanylate cyclase (GGDEF)-like protein/PAS domain S-box-containing protein